MQNQNCNVKNDELGGPGGANGEEDVSLYIIDRNASGNETTRKDMMYVGDNIKTDLVQTGCGWCGLDWSGSEWRQLGSSFGSGNEP
jgi:hypothetical protein